LQLTIYAFAYQMMRERVPDELCLHFIESGLVGSSPIGSHPLQEHTEQIRAVVAGIRAQEFSARPSQQRCRNCPYVSVCESAST